jgi:hypothetical protein
MKEKKKRLCSQCRARVQFVLAFSSLHADRTIVTCTSISRNESTADAATAMDRDMQYTYVLHASSTMLTIRDTLIAKVTCEEP